ncbi:MAG: hypothetical protein ACD_77C00206G0004 [uncultured bacterium]|nr:MAG: hypothetical protein ACD_77C00206G0004 [uncultured bacterium]
MQTSSMKTFIHPSFVKGSITAPSSKSFLQRAIIAATLASGHSVLSGCSHCSDTVAVTEIARTLGAKIEQRDDKMMIDGGFVIPSSELNCNESGLALRIISPIAALLLGETTINGKGTLLKRPVDPIVDALTLLGIKVTASEKGLPLKISGFLKGGDIEIDGSKGSQLLSGLLMALPLADNNSNITVSQLKSKPYIDMTIGMLKQFGIEILNDNYEHFAILGNQKYRSTNYYIEGDWSGASFLLVAGACAGEIEIKGLNIKSKQADARIMEVLSAAGANIELSDNSVVVKKNRLDAFEFNAEDCPDLFPPLVALASQCSAPSVIYGVSRLFSKESNRALTLKHEFDKIGVEIITDGNKMVVKPSKICFNSTNSHNDHRIAMALSIAALCSEKGVEIDDFDCINKSYPDFLNDLRSVSNQQ